jgi:hypothetical protein
LNITGAIVKLYKDQASGTPIATGDAVLGAIPLTLPTSEELSQNTTTKFYLVLDGSTLPANTTLNTETQLVNVVYDDVFQDVDLEVDNLSTYSNAGLPLKWSK